MNQQYATIFHFCIDNYLSIDDKIDYDNVC